MDVNTSLIFAKEELPTWAEMYSYHMYDNHYTYSQNSSMDPYWKIPRSLYLLGVCVNQLNKMAIDNHMDDIRFVIDHYTGNDVPIYTFELPTGKPNPFIIPHDGFTRIKLDPNIEHTAFMYDKTDEICRYDLCDTMEYKELMKPILEYFKDRYVEAYNG